MRAMVYGAALCAFAGVTLAAAGPAKPNAGDPLAPVGITAKQPVAPVKPVTETMFGTKVTDNYRYMEAMDPAMVAWMKQQGAYTRAVFDSIKPRAALGKRVADFGASFGFVQQYQSYGGRAFYEYRAPGSDNFDLMVADAKGTRKLVDVAALRAAHGGEPYAINFFQASYDGAKVAVGISAGGSEDASTYVYDPATGKQVAGPVDRTQFGVLAWSQDGNTLYLNRLYKMKPSDPTTQKYQNSTVEAWDLKSGFTPTLGTSVGHGPHFEPVQFPAIGIPPDSQTAFAVNINGVQNEWEVSRAPLAKVADPKTQWQKFVDRSDGITNLDSRRGELFLLSHKNAPTFQLLSLQEGQSLSQAKVLLPARPDRVVESMRAASDALYVKVRQGIYSHLLRIPAGKTEAEDIALPFKGEIGEMFADSRAPGVTLTLESWQVPPTQFRFDPKTGKFTELKLGVTPAYDSSAIVVQDIEAKARDGEMVPLTVLEQKNAHGPQIVLMRAYGSYGISDLPVFSPRVIVFVREGAAYADCHVRGGGELGEAWRLGGKDANKHNTWQDLIACGEALVARGITTKDKLFIFGGSAGGITMGRSLTERPDLWAGVIDAVPAANTLRAEFSTNGPDNIPEFGSVKTEQGFKNLYGMDTLQHVKDGTHYPAVLITTGLNDPRVSPWEPAKLAARLQAAGTPNPVLLRVDEKAGHGIGSTKSQSDELYSDVYAFVFWRGGRPEWRPDATKH
jgi:prolyl oligopeptidase